MRTQTLHLIGQDSSATTEAMFTAAFGAMPVAAAIIDSVAPYTIKAHNAAYGRCWLGTEPGEELVGRTLVHLLQEADERALVALQEVSSTRTPRVVRHLARGGQTAGRAYWNWHLTPIMKEGHMISIAHVLTDVTDEAVTIRRQRAELKKREEADEARRRSEAVLVSITESIDALVYAKDDAGRFLFCNDPMARFLGIAANEAVGKRPEDLPCASLQSDMVMKHDAEIAENGLPTSLVQKVTARDGSERSLFNRKAPLRLAGMEGPGVVSIATDITRQKATETELRRRETRLEAVLGAARLGSWHWNIATGDVELNDRWAEMLGYELEEIEQSFATFERLCHPDDLDRTRAALEDHFEGRSDRFSLEIRMRHREARWIWVHTSGGVVERDDEGRPLIATGTHQDVTERVEAQVRLERHDKELARERAFLAELIEAIPVGVSIARDPQGKPATLNEEARRMLGGRPKGFKGSVQRYEKLQAFQANGQPYGVEDYPTVRALKSGEVIQDEEMIYGEGESRRRWLLNSRPVYDDGEIVAAVTSIVDVEELRLAEERTRMINRELKHRVKNLFAVTQGIVRVAARNESDPKALARNITERVSALASAHSVGMDEDRLAPVAIEEVVRAVLAPYCCSQDRLDLSGPEVSIPRQLVTPFGLLLYELATNAVKYGALSDEAGRLHVTWVSEPKGDGSGERVVRFSWQERLAVPAHSQPEGREPGLGSLLLQQAAKQLRGKIRQTWFEGGLQTILTFPSHD